MGNSGSVEADVEPQPTGGKGPDAFLNVYEPTGDGQRGMLGMGVYHTGIEISGIEYAYGGGSVSESGVYTQTPKEEPPGNQWRYKCTIRLGKIKVLSNQLHPIITKAKKEFAANHYNVVNKNCNHFTEYLAKSLGVDINYPSWVNRAARMGSRFGVGGASAETAEAVPPPESVFKTTKGHSLVDDEHKSSSSKTDPKAAPGKRVNPWADPNFKPTNVVDDSAAVKK